MHSLKGILHDLFRREIKNGLLLGHSFLSTTIHSITTLKIKNQLLTYQRSANYLASGVILIMPTMIDIDKEKVNLLCISHYIFDLICNYIHFDVMFHHSQNRPIIF